MVIIKNLIKRTFKLTVRLINFVSPKLATKLLHYKITKKNLNLKNPTDFNSKLQWLKLYGQNRNIVTAADKYEMYSFVEKLGCSEILNKLIGVYDDAHDICWDKLPEKVAIKCTHGCGYNIVTKKLSSLDKTEIVTQLQKWQKEDFGLENLEFHYSSIKPRIIIEEFIENKAGELPIDYKIYCFDGKAKLVLVCSERESELKLDFFDLNWNRLNIGHPENESKCELHKPDCFEEMVKYAEKISSQFKFVRIDFYDKDGIPILGEFTFTPAANMANYYNEYGLELLGRYLDLDK